MLGCWIAFLAGCLAGFVIAAAINAIVAWGPQANISNILILAAGPALTILFLYILAMPGVMQGLGLTGIKAGGVEITLTPPPGLRTDVPSFTPSESGGAMAPLSGDYTPWFKNIWPMFRELNDPSHKEFLDQAYFQRETAYLKYLGAKVRVPITADDAKQNPPVGVAKTIWEQEELLRSLRPVFGCGGFYHLIFPDVPSMRPALTPVLDTLVAVETELEAISTAPSAPTGWASDLRARLAILPRQAGDLVQRFRSAIPPSAIETTKLSGDDPPKWEDCTPSEFDPHANHPDLALKPIVSSTGDVDVTIQPPYLAMLIANVYSALGEKDAGLKVLNGWIKYYKDYKGKYEHPQWLYDRAILEYGIIQEANEPVPTSTQERKYLQWMQTLFLSDWHVDLDNDGFKCGDLKARADLQADLQAKITAGDATPSAAGVKARLHLLYSNIVHRLLYVTIETLPNVDRETITPEHEHWARQLISSAEKCLLDEGETARDYRQTLNLFSGGIALARWAEDGPRSGLLHPSTITDVRKDALHALLAALPSILQHEEADGREVDGPFRTNPTEWETYRRISERTILDLEAKLTR